MKLPWIDRKQHEKQLTASKAVNERLKRQVEQLRAPMFPDREAGAMEHVLTDAKGRRYAKFANVLDTPGVRGLRLQRIHAMASMNVTPELLSEFYDEIMKLFDKGLISEGMALMLKLRDRSKLKAGPDIILELAALHYIREDEDPDTVDDAMIQDKIAYWNTDPECLSFFLTQCFRSIYNCNELRDEHLLTYLGNAREALEELLPSPKE